jgi:C_GCAxxG_C_C family probable redox protein
LSFKEYFGIRDSIVPGLATGFGGGIGGKGSLCGNFTGSVIVIGMKFGRKDSKDQDSKEKVYKACYDFWNRFEKEFGSCICYDLINCHLDNKEELRRWFAAGGMEKCADLVERTARILFDFINEI